MVFPFVRSKQSRVKRIKIRYPDIRWLDRVGATSIHEINTETIPTLNLSRGKRETVILIYWSPSFPIYIFFLSLSMPESEAYRTLINFQDIRDREGRSKRRVSRNTADRHRAKSERLRSDYTPRNVITWQWNLARKSRHVDRG